MEGYIFFLYPSGLSCMLLFGDHWSRAVVLNHFLFLKKDQKYYNTYFKYTERRLEHMQTC